MIEVFVLVIMKNSAVIEANEAYKITKAVREIKGFTQG